MTKLLKTLLIFLYVALYYTGMILFKWCMLVPQLFFIILTQ